MSCRNTHTLIDGADASPTETAMGEYPPPDGDGAMGLLHSVLPHNDHTDEEYDGESHSPPPHRTRILFSAVVLGCAYLWNEFFAYPSLNRIEMNSSA